MTGAQPSPYPRPMRHPAAPPSALALMASGPGHELALRRRGYVVAEATADAPAAPAPPVPRAAPAPGATAPAPVRTADTPPLADGTPTPAPPSPRASAAPRGASAAERMRATRARRREGRCVPRIELAAEHLERLIRVGLLPATQRDDQVAIGEAIRRVIEGAAGDKNGGPFRLIGCAHSALEQGMDSVASDERTQP